MSLFGIQGAYCTRLSLYNRSVSTSHGFYSNTGRRGVDLDALSGQWSLNGYVPLKPLNAEQPVCEPGRNIVSFVPEEAEVDQEALLLVDDETLSCHSVLSKDPGIVSSTARVRSLVHFASYHTHAEMYLQLTSMDGDPSMKWLMLYEHESLDDLVMFANLARVRVRVSELGRLGVALFSELLCSDLLSRRTTREEVVHLSMIGALNENRRAAAYSILCLDFPIQTKGVVADVFWLADSSLRRLLGTPVQVDFDCKLARKRAFPLKSHPGASNKVNVYLSEVIISARACDGAFADEFTELSGHIAGKLSDDQACACAMLAAALKKINVDGIRLAMRMCLDIEGAKNLNLVLKSLGYNGMLEGAMLCEGKCLAGRGSDYDLDSDWRYRVDEAGVQDKIHHVPIDALRRAVKEVLATEIKSDIEFETPAELWKRRWLWCVNGAHSKVLGRIDPTFVVDHPELVKKRLHRRVFVENLKDEPITGWRGESYFNLSAKLENGATRAIYGGDSITYFAFEHLLRPIENAWFNRRVILDPGQIGTFGMARRLRRLHGSDQGVHVMLDYDDYNARHALSYQAMVIEELVKHVGYDPILGKKLVDSFSHSYLVSPDTKEFLPICRTLMSGHRATTFINSVLNYAYIACVYPQLRDMASMHVGDDVYIKANSYAQAFELLSACRSGGLAMNPIKQSVGTTTAEFLRVAYRRTHACGYLIRSIAACVSGNWVSEMQLDPDEGLRTILSHAWTLENRSNYVGYSALLKASFVRMTGIGGRIASNLLSGDWSLLGEAHRYRRLNTVEVRLKSERTDDQVAMRDKIASLEGAATQDYLTFQARPIELYALQNSRVEISGLMKEASYTKTLTEPGAQRSKFVGIRKVKKVLKGFLHMDDAWNLRPVTGCMEKYPIIQLIRNAIPTELLQDMVHSELNIWADGEELEMLAWGNEEKGSALVGRTSYADAGRISARAFGRMVHNDYSCYV